jgi:acetyl esterase/lipase
MMQPSTQNIIPETISPEAQKILQNLIEAFDPDSKYPEPTDFSGWKKLQSELDLSKSALNEKVVHEFGAKLVEKQLNDLKYIEVYPKNYQESEKVIIYLHGGGYTFYTAKTSLTGSVPMAAQSGKKVIVLDYPLAPQANFKVILQHFKNLYTHLLENGTDAKNIVIYGDSAGAGLAGGGLLKLKKEGFQMPSSVVLWSPWSDLSARGDTYLTLVDRDPKLHLGRLMSCALAYASRNEHRNPYVSPIYGEYDHSFPPTLIQVGTREMFLSDAVRLFQKMEDQGVEVTFDIYEGMWHAWQKEYTMPEAKKAVLKTCNFIEKHWK